jgi:predicted kinase
MTEKTYAKMAEEAERLIREGEAVILDATFSLKAHRETILHLAAKYKIPLALIQCQCSEEIVQERLVRRAEEGRDLSDGRWGIYVQQKADLEPIQEISPERILILDTNGSPAQLVRRVERFLRHRLVAVKRMDLK